MIHTDADDGKIDMCNEKDFEVMVKQSINKIFVRRTGNMRLISLEEENEWNETQTDDEKYGIWM